MRSQASIEIDRPIEEVFRYTTQCVADWSEIVVEERVVKEVPGVVGTVFEVVTEERGQRMAFDGVVTAHEPPTLSVVEMTGKQFEMRVEYRFEDLGGQTRVTQTSRVRGKGLFKVLFILLGWAFRKSSCAAAAKELAGLKQKLAAGTAR